jgi:GT2 family glycosyltransferase
MRIFVLIPVFNRLKHTERVLEALRCQSLYRNLEIIVINDGSTDGTDDFLSAQADVTNLKGNGNLWWGGAIQLGLEYVDLKSPNSDDYVLFLNNDTWFEADYVALLVDASKKADGAAVGSAVREVEHDPPLTSIGARISINHCACWDLLSELSLQEVRMPKEIYRVDALSGRGTLYPALLFRRFGKMRPLLLPHYMGDYEVAMRFARRGVKLLVSTRAFVYSPPVYGNDTSKMGFWERRFSRRSSGNIIYCTFFYMLVGSPLQRLTAPLRLLAWSLLRVISKWKQKKAI